MSEPAEVGAPEGTPPANLTAPSGAEDGTPAVVITRRRVLVVVGALMMGMFLAALDQTVVQTALPTIVGDLHGASHLTWVVTAYLLSSTVSTPLWGKLGDQYGRKFFFQASIVIFVGGSILSGLSTSMLELIVFRALQGLGGGGLMIGAQTILGDVMSPRERGRYMGLFMAMFGVTTVIGPLIGGIFVDSIGWRWIFYINVPVGVVALVVTAVALPGNLRRVQHVIDYLGAVLLALAATGMVLFTSLGGATYSWTSPPILALIGVSVALTVAFVLAERRAAEPVMPLKLFSNKVFNSASAIGFVIGFALFGAMTFVPLFLQTVKGVSPTDSGVRLFPMMGGLLVASIVSGQLVSRWGRYRVFPILGTALATIGILVMSWVGVSTSGWVLAGGMFLFGLGCGLVMQVLVVAVQNAVPYEELGAATSSSTFFRMIGGSFGTAVFGALFTSLLSGNLARFLHGVPIPAGVSSELDNPAVLAKLPAAVHSGVVNAVAHTVQTVFLVGVPITAVSFLLSWLLPEVQLRRSIRTTSPAEGLGIPEGRSSLGTIELALERVAARENRPRLYQLLAERAGLDLRPPACWLLFRLEGRDGVGVSSLAEQLKVSEQTLESGLQQLSGEGLVVRARQDGHDALWLTAPGRAALERLTAARRAGMTELLEGWDLQAHPEVLDMVRRLAKALLADDEKLVADARSATAVGQSS